MPIIASPDLAAAIMLYIRDSTDVAAFVASRVFLEWPSGQDKIVVPPFRNCILVVSGRGGRGEIGSGLREERVDIQCYGADRKTAYDIWRTLDWYLAPADRSRKTNFVKANCRVSSLTLETQPLRLVDARTSWNFVDAPYRFIYSAVPVS